jgi:DNA polymerase III subunit epsilon
MDSQFIYAFYLIIEIYYNKPMFKDNNFTIVDLETTGGSPFFNRIIEIGLLRVQNGEVVEKYETFINPGIPIPSYITKITGIETRHLSDAPYFEEVAQDLLKKFHGAIFVAHNVSFDYGFLQNEFHRLGYDFSYPQLCTVKLSRALFPEHRHHNLSAIIDRYGLACINRHRAFDDAKVLLDFMSILTDKIPDSALQIAFKKTLKTQR